VTISTTVIASASKKAQNTMTLKYVDEGLQVLIALRPSGTENILGPTFDGSHRRFQHLDHLNVGSLSLCRFNFLFSQSLVLLSFLCSLPHLGFAHGKDSYGKFGDYICSPLRDLLSPPVTHLLRQIHEDLRDANGRHAGYTCLSNKQSSLPSAIEKL
jgi:hypothetical protein